MQKKAKLHIAKALSPQIGFIVQDKKTALWGFVAVFLFLGISGWLPDGVESLLFEDNKFKGIFLVGISVVILGVFFYVLYEYSKNLDFEIFETAPEKKLVVILLLSIPYKIDEYKAAFMRLLYSDREFEYVSTSNYQTKAFDIEIVKNES